MQTEWILRDALRDCEPAMSLAKVLDLLAEANLGQKSVEEQDVEVEAEKWKKARGELAQLADEWIASGGR